MYRKHTVLALIPARGGSKRLPGKNLKLLGGKTLLARAVSTARKSRLVDRVLVSTDSPRIRRIALRVGAEAPFLRPKKLATDTSPVVETIRHTLSYLESREKFKPDIVVIVQATSPFVEARDIDAAIQKLISSGSNSCVSVCPISERPEWMFSFRKNGLLARSSGIPMFRRSQDLPTLFRLNGSVNATRAEVIKKKRTPFDPARMTAHVMPKERSIDIDDASDLTLARALFRARTR